MIVFSCGIENQGLVGAGAGVVEVGGFFFFWLVFAAKCCWFCRTV